MCGVRSDSSPSTWQLASRWHRQNSCTSASVLSHARRIRAESLSSYLSLLASCTAAPSAVLLTTDPVFTKAPESAMTVLKDLWQLLSAVAQSSSSPYVYVEQLRGLWRAEKVSDDAVLAVMSTAVSKCEVRLMTSWSSHDGRQTTCAGKRQVAVLQLHSGLLPQHVATSPMCLGLPCWH
jgi:hypothetical protein